MTISAAVVAILLTVLFTASRNRPVAAQGTMPTEIVQMKKTFDRNTKYEKPDQVELKEQLTELQYAVTQQAATEPPFHNAYNKEFREGIYCDVTTGQPLFVSTDKFESGCGWPSFSRPISESVLEKREDRSFGMMRTEIMSKASGAHLGHVFNDGPKKSGGLRYCINSASLRFIPRDEMKANGYGAYLDLFAKIL